MKQKPIDPFFHQSMFYTVIGEDGYTVGEVFVIDRSLLPRQKGRTTNENDGDRPRNQLHRMGNHEQRQAN